MMTEASSFGIRFGKTARTLVYEDAIGSICFAFDLSPAEGSRHGKWNLQLGDRALTLEGGDVECRADPERDRIRVARERVVEYAKSRGYIVEPDKC